MPPHSPTKGTNQLPSLPCAAHLQFSTLSSPTHRLAATSNAMGLHFMRHLAKRPHQPRAEVDDDPALDSLHAAEELASIALGTDPGLVGAGSAETYTGLVVVESLKARGCAEVEEGEDVGGRSGNGSGRDWSGPEGEDREVVKRDKEEEQELDEMGGYVAEWVRDAIGWQMVGFCGMDEVRSGRQSGGVGGVKMYHTTTSAVLVGSCWLHGWKVSVSVGELCG